MIMNKHLKLLLVLVAVASSLSLYFVARASSLTNTKDVLSTVKAGVVANHEIFFVSPTGTAAGSTVILTFTGFTTTGVTFQDVDIARGNSGNCTTATFTEDVVAGSAGVATWGVSNANPAITLTAPTSGGGLLAAGNCLRVRIGTNTEIGTAGSNQITNASSGLRTISITGDFGDTGEMSVYLITDDQVSISATVAQALTFSLSSTTIGFGTLSTSNVRYASNDSAGAVVPTTAHNLQASTNASNGYVITVKGATLTSGANTITAIGGSNTAIASGTEQFGVRFSSSGGSGGVVAPYAASGFAYGADATTTSQIASSTVPSDTTTYNATYIADISTLTEPGSYTTALTYVATANY